MTDQPENAAQKQRGKPFTKGKSGNPAGKPKGTRHRATQLIETLMQGGAEAIVAVVVKAAEKGDLQAARIVLDRIAPIRRDRPVEIDLPALDSPSALTRAGEATLAKMAAGELTPVEAGEVLALLERQARLIESTEIEARLAALEARASEAAA